MHLRKTCLNPSYRCPLCDRSPRDYDLSPLVPQPICGSCTDFRDMVRLEDERPNEPKLERLEQLTRVKWDEYRIALLRENLATWREIEKDPQQDYIKRYIEWSGWSEGETWAYV